MIDLEAVHREVIDAWDARVALNRRIAAAGMPPHADFWSQATFEADARLNRAVDALRVAVKEKHLAKFASQVADLCAGQCQSGIQPSGCALAMRFAFPTPKA